MCPEIGYTMIYCCTMIYPRIATIYYIYKWWGKWSELLDTGFWKYPGILHFLSKPTSFMSLAIYIPHDHIQIYPNLSHSGCLFLPHLAGLVEGWGRVLVQIGHCNASTQLLRLLLRSGYGKSPFFHGDWSSVSKCVCFHSMERIARGYRNSQLICVFNKKSLHESHVLLVSACFISIWCSSKKSFLWLFPEMNCGNLQTCIKWPFPWIWGYSKSVSQ